MSSSQWLLYLLHFALLAAIAPTMHSPMYLVTFVAYLVAEVGGTGNDETLRSRLTEKEYPSWSTSNAVRTAPLYFELVAELVDLLRAPVLRVPEGWRKPSG